MSNKLFSDSYILVTARWEIFLYCFVSNEIGTSEQQISNKFLRYCYVQFRYYMYIVNVIFL